MNRVPPHYADKHSPGPWKWVPFKNWDGGLQAADGSYVIRNDETDNTPENRHDAALIASAPAMAEMLRSLEWAGRYDYPDIGDVKCCPCCYALKLKPEMGKPAGPHKPDCKLAALLSTLPEAT